MRERLLKEPLTADYKYFKILTTGMHGKKTHTYRILNKRGELLGEIKWYSAWRQYCFYPLGNSIWNIDCLADVQDFLIRLKRARLEKTG